MTHKSASAAESGQDRIDPTRAAAAASRWRRALAESLGQDPGATLDEPRRVLAMLKVFGSTRRLADLCLKHPVFAARALMEGPSQVLAEAARDLTALNGGVGGADALYAALAPIKNRADLAMAIAEISGEWTSCEATAARADLAERVVETALAWLVRGAANRGELAIDLDDAGPRSVFALAGGDFAHEDLAPYGPVELLVVYDGAAFEGPAARMAERAFVRIGAEMKEALEGRPGEYPLYALKTPQGSGVSGAGVVEARARLAQALKDPQQNAFRRWIATARVVAGDRRAGGEFLEGSEEAIWSGDLLTDEARAQLLKASDDPRTVFRNAANLLRWSLGRSRAVFRTASARDVFRLAAGSGALAADEAARLGGGAEFAQSLVSRAQTMKGAAAFSAGAPDEEEALAALCGYGDAAALAAVRTGLLADARNALGRLLEGPRREFARYAAVERNPDDVDKLEDLGFGNGQDLSSMVDGWAALCAAGGNARFSSIAPGLLTAFGETQHPDEAARLFDRLMHAGRDGAANFAALRPAARDAMIDAIGCFGGVIEPAVEDPHMRVALFEQPQALTAPAPAPNVGAGLDAVARWRRGEIARVAMAAADGALDFDAAAHRLNEVYTAALERVFEIASADGAGGPGVALYIFDGAGRGLPGYAAPMGLVGDAGDAERREAVARSFRESLEALGEGAFSINPDFTHRPGGVAGALAPDLAALRGYIQSEAVAHNQILIARARVIAGPDKTRAAATQALRSGVSNPKRAEVLLRDLDRARAQRLRRDRAGSPWDLEQSEGGLFDVELIISMLHYRHAGALPAMQSLSAPDALDLMSRSGVLSPDVAETLKGARAFWTRLATVRALARWSDPQREPVRPRFAALIARAAEVDSYSQVRPIMRGYADEVARLYAQLVLGRPTLALVSNA